MPVRPADAAPGHLAAAQVDALEAPRVHVDLEQGPRGGHALDLAAVHLDREHRPLGTLVGVGAQRRAEQVVEGAQHLVLGEAADRLQGAGEAGVGLADRRRAVAGHRGVEAGGERAVEGPRRPGVAHEDAVHRVRVPVGADLQQVVAQRAQHLDVAPGEAGGEDETVQRVVGRPLLVEGAQGVHEALLPLPQRGDAVGRGLDLEAVEEAAAALGQGERDAQLVGDGEPEVLQGLQGVGEVERAHRAQLHGGGLRRLRDDARLEPALERLHLPQVVRHLRRRRHLAVEAAARLRRHVPAEEAPALALPELALEGDPDAVLPVGDEGLGEPARLLDVHRVLELVRVEVEDEERHRPAVHRGAEGHRAERVGEGAPQGRLDLVGVAQPREGHVEGLVARSLAALHHDLVVARHVHDALDDPLEVGGVRVEEVGLREVVEGGPGLAPDVGARDGPAALQETVLLLLEDRDAVGALGEGPAGKAAEQEGDPRELPVLAPLAHGEVLDRLEVVDGRGVRAEVEVEDPVVARLRVEVGLDVLDDAREDDGEERGVGEDAVRRLVHADGRAVRPHAVGDGAHEDVVVVEQPLEEGAGGEKLRRVAAAAAQPGHHLPAGPPHVLEVVDREEDGLEQREHLVLDPAPALLRRDRLDLEEAVALLAALFLHGAEGRDPLPLPPHREDRVDGRVHPQALLLQVVLEAVEDERPVGRVRLEDRRLERQPPAAPERAGLVLGGVPDRHVDPRQALVELVRRGHLLRHEAEVRGEPRGHHRRRQVEREPGRHVREEDRGDAQQQLEVLGRGLPLQDLRHLREPCRTLVRVAVHHVEPLLPTVEPWAIVPGRPGEVEAAGAATIPRPTPGDGAP